MRILRFDGTGGASGDLALGALAAVGADLDTARRAIRALGLGEDLRLVAEPAQDHGISGIRVTVECPAHGAGTRPRAAHHDHGVHDHAPARGSSHDATGHGHRDGAAIAAMIDRADLPARVKALSQAVFQRLAEAEGRIHGVPADRVRFHEVGALDSIADIVGACAMIDALSPDRVECAPLPLGHGEVRCAHGVYPLPAPATMELLRDFPVRRVEETQELVTPTGAALMVEWCARFQAPVDADAARPVMSGYGLGHHALSGRANVLRATVLETSAASPDAPERVRVLECEMDDCTGEWVGELGIRLMEAGALDVYVTGVQMKKQRPGFLLTVLARPEDGDRLSGMVFARGTTFGIREYECRRRILDRCVEQVKTPYGSVRVKIGRWKGCMVTVSPEMDDCVALSVRAGVSPREIYRAAQSVLPGAAKPCS